MKFFLILLVFVFGLSDNVFSIYSFENRSFSGLQGPNSKIKLSLEQSTSGISDLALGSSHSCAIFNGSVKCWGNNSYGQLGNGNNLNSSAPVTVLNISDAVLIAAGENHTCVLVANGRVKCWGRNNRGQLGDGTFSNRNYPIDVGLSGIMATSISTRGSHTCITTSNMTVKCWGWNSLFQIGDNTQVDRTTPVDAWVIGNNIIKLATGGQHTCALQGNERVMCWGASGAGQLGNGSSDTSSFPVFTSNLEAGVVDLEGNGSHNCALQNGGGLKCWGLNTNGQIGNGATNNQLLPVEVVGLTSGVTQVTLGEYHSCAIFVGTAQCWGRNDFGQLGNGSIVSRSLYASQVMGIASPISKIVGGGYHTCALVGDNSIQCWGLNASGQLGNGSFTNSSLPVYVLNFLPPTNTPTSTSTNTPVPTSTFTPTRTPTPTASSTNTATPSRTFTPLPTPTSTPTNGPTPTPIPGLGDNFEPDDTCASARVIATNGTVQQHTFYRYGDEDWIQMEVISGSNYVIEGVVPQDSPANLELEYYGTCSGVPVGQNPTFSPGVRQGFTANYSGLFRFRLLNASPGVFGSNVTYAISVRDMTTPPPVGAVIVVGGRQNDGDHLQNNINSVTDRIYRMFLRYRHSDNDIFYMATDSALSGWDAIPSVAALHNAITTWAPSHVDADHALTIYMVDHGWEDAFYLDGAGQVLTPDLLDGWLTELETLRPGVKINVIIDACYSGSFITRPHSISKGNRLIVTSAKGDELAYASYDGAIFSDFFVNNLDRATSVFDAFTRATWAVRASYSVQNPQLDDNGDGVMDAKDGAEAMRRGFGNPGSFSGPYNWPPYIAEAQTQNDSQPDRRIIRARVLDDGIIGNVYAVIYPPSYVPPTGGDRLIPDTLQTTLLLPQGNGWFAASYPGFTEKGTYKIVIYAQDQMGALAQPLQITSGSMMYLPMVWR